MILINDNAIFTEICTKILQSKNPISLDTEFIRINTYYPILSLLQFATYADPIIPELLPELPEKIVNLANTITKPQSKPLVYIVDVLSGIDLTIMKEILLSNDIVKIIHASKQDLDALYGSISIFPTNIIDTQILAMFDGFTSLPSYDSIVRRYLNVDLCKSEQFSNWLHRPLRTTQLHYAANDVRYLLLLFPILKNKLEITGKFEWAMMECMNVLSKYKSHLLNDFGNDKMERMLMKFSHILQSFKNQQDSAKYNAKKGQKALYLKYNKSVDKSVDKFASAPENFSTKKLNIEVGKIVSETYNIDNDRVQTLAIESAKSETQKYSNFAKHRIHTLLKCNTIFEKQLFIALRLLEWREKNAIKMNMLRQKLISDDDICKLSIKFSNLEIALDQIIIDIITNIRINESVIEVTSAITEYNNKINNNLKQKHKFVDINDVITLTSLTDISKNSMQQLFNQSTIKSCIKSEKRLEMPHLLNNQDSREVVTKNKHNFIKDRYADNITIQYLSSELKQCIERNLILEEIKLIRRVIHDKGYYDALHITKNTRVKSGTAALTYIIKALLKTTSLKWDIAEEMIASSNDISLIAAASVNNNIKMNSNIKMNNKNCDAIIASTHSHSKIHSIDSDSVIYQGWRNIIFGQYVKSLIEGCVSLRFDIDHIELIEHNTNYKN